jgi:imidazole glycerol-phosphate synthase subunit HisF
MRRVRVIPVLLLAQDGLVKTRGFVRPQYLGDPINAVKIFSEKQADELILLDIEATPKARLDFDRIEDIVSEAFMPIAYGGGLASVDQCAELFCRGVEKVVINTAACAQPGLIARLADRFGAQAVVVSIDARRNMWKQWKAYVKGARKATKFSPAELAQASVALGAGEIFLTCVEREGAFAGYDLELVKSVAGAVDVPVIAHGGAGSIADFEAAVRYGGASAVAAGSMFVFAAKGEGMLISYPTNSELLEQFWLRLT